jgi:hypothetical protein
MRTNQNMYFHPRRRIPNQMIVTQARDAGQHTHTARHGIEVGAGTAQHGPSAGTTKRQSNDEGGYHDGNWTMSRLIFDG